MQYRDGKGLFYASGHPPAGYFYRYERASDSAVSIYSIPILPEEAEILAFRAFPRRMLTKFVDVESGESEWLWKLPASAERREIVSSQEIVKTRWDDEEHITRSFFSPDFEELRIEKTTREELRIESRNIRGR